MLFQSVVFILYVLCFSMSHITLYISELVPLWRSAWYQGIINDAGFAGVIMHPSVQKYGWIMFHLFFMMAIYFYMTEAVGNDAYVPSVVYQGIFTWYMLVLHLNIIIPYTIVTYVTHIPTLVFVFYNWTVILQIIVDTTVYLSEEMTVDNKASATWSLWMLIPAFAWMSVSITCSVIMFLYSDPKLWVDVHKKDDKIKSN